MSATGRGAERRADDFYATPAKTTRAILPTLLRRRTSDGPMEPWSGGRILEPAAGNGAIIAELIAYGVQSIEIDAFEIDRKRADTSGAVCANFLEQTPAPVYGAVITNPPFVDAFEFAQHGVKFLRPGGVLALLVRLNWLASFNRARWLRDNTPSVHVLPERPSFAASMKCKQECGWKTTAPLDSDVGVISVSARGKKHRRCPDCGSLVTRVTSDATDYAWMTWRRAAGDAASFGTNPFTTPRVSILEIAT